MEEKELNLSDIGKTPTKELKHSGVKGMKWGQRRYQNKDGSLTPLGEKRYGNIKDVDSRNKKIKDDSYNQHKELGKGVKDLADASSKLTKDIASGSKPSKKVRKQMSTMSNKELQDVITRASLESQYAALHPSRKARGAERAGRALSTIGSIASIAAAGATTALAINQLISKG